jgi:hypothetical protein
MTTRFATKALLIKLGASIGAVGLLGTGLIGFMHTDAGKPMLHWFANQAGCPVSFDDSDPAKVEAYRSQRLREKGGDEPALSAPALGFQLGAATKEQVKTWLSSQGVNCDEKRQGSVLQCENVKLTQQPEIANLHLQFDAAERLVAVDVQRTQACGQDAVRHLSKLQKELETDVGPVTAARGQLDAQYLEQASFQVAATEFRYSNYLAKLSATHLGAGVKVREQYQWVSTAAN